MQTIFIKCQFTQTETVSVFSGEKIKCLRNPVKPTWFPFLYNASIRHCFLLLTRTHRQTISAHLGKGSTYWILLATACFLTKVKAFKVTWRVRGWTVHSGELRSTHWDYFMLAKSPESNKGVKILASTDLQVPLSLLLCNTDSNLRAWSNSCVLTIWVLFLQTITFKIQILTKIFVQGPTMWTKTLCNLLVWGLWITRARRVYNKRWYINQRRTIHFLSYLWIFYQ